MNTAGILMVAIGAAILLVASLGLFRLRDPLSRQHAATKAGSLGIVIVVLGAAVSAGEAGWWIRAGVITVIVWATLPVASHVLARAAYRQAKHGDLGDPSGRRADLPSDH